jgi:hypothetical protein
MPSIDQTWVLASIGAVVEMGVLSTLKQLLMELSSVIVIWFEILLNLSSVYIPTFVVTETSFPEGSNTMNFFRQPSRNFWKLMPWDAEK